MTERLHEDPSMWTHDECLKLLSQRDTAREDALNESNEKRKFEALWENEVEAHKVTRAEAEEQARLLGMSASREAKLLAEAEGFKQLWQSAVAEAHVLNRVSVGLRAQLAASQSEAARLKEAADAGFDLSKYAAGIRWSDAETNTAEWLVDLKEKIIAMQGLYAALASPNPQEG